MSLDQSNQLLSIIGNSMFHFGSGDWIRVTLEVTGVRSMINSGLEIEYADGSVNDSEVIDNQGADAYAKLRDAMYSPEKGTWYIAHFSVDRTGHLDAQFDYDSPPLDGNATAEMLIDDQKKYPRAPEFLPDWHPSRPIAQ